MEFGQLTTVVAFLLVIAAGVGGTLLTPMATDTVLTMVAPSMVVFGLVMLLLGVKHGEYRATQG